MNNQNIQTKIDNYLLNRMSEAECKDFEVEMAADSKLNETVELQRLLVTEIKQRAFIAEIIEETKRRMGKEDETNEVQIPFQKPIPPAAASKNTLRKIMLVAWSAAAIFAGAFFVNQAFVNNRMDNLYSQYYSSPEVDVMRGEPTRGIDFIEKDFKQAIQLLEKNEPKQAHEILLKLYQSTNIYNYYEDVRWYLALTELKLHNKPEAIKYLKELMDSEYYGAKASTLLEEL